MRLEKMSPNLEMENWEEENFILVSEKKKKKTDFIWILVPKTIIISMEIIV